MNDRSAGPANTSELMREDWNKRAKQDAYYYVAFARPGQNAEEFKATADRILPFLEEALARLPVTDGTARRALEIGCGPGRLMIPMSRYFNEIRGVDVSDEMIALAKDLLSTLPKAHAHVNNGVDLALFPDGYFDYAYSYLVFQHIPSKDIVLGYLSEVERVLKSGGVFCGQFRESPVGGQADTWSGCSFTSDEIAEFVSRRGLLLLSISGEGTPYMGVTLQKGTRFPCSALPGAQIPPEITLAAVTATDGGTTVPERGSDACLSLWGLGLPGGSDLADLTVDIGGTTLRGCWLGPVGEHGAYQLNTRLPRNVERGRVQVKLRYRGAVLGEGSVLVAPGPARSPKLTLITDGIDLTLNAQVRCGKFKAVLEDIENPGEVTFLLDGKAVIATSYECIEASLDSYYYTVTLPRGVREGNRSLCVRVGERELPTVRIKVL